MTMEREDGTTREELVQRVALMEEMIAEGRRITARYGWIFVLWGLTYFAAIGWTCTYHTWSGRGRCASARAAWFGVMRSREPLTGGRIDNCADAAWMRCGR